MDKLGVLAKRLVELREKLNISQADFSDSLGLKKQTYSAYEKSINNPPITVLINISEKYDVSLDWLCGLTDDNGRSKVTFDTYADVLNVIFEIGMLDIAQTKDNSCDSGHDHLGIFFDNENINEALKDWKKMHDLLRDGFVDEEVYSLWVEKTLKKYNMKIADQH